MNPSIRPSSAPVTREPTACANGDGAPFLAWSLSISGLTISAKPSTFAWSQPRRSTTRTGAVRSSATRPVNPRTRGVDRSAPARSSATTSSASTRLTEGPSPERRAPTLTAVSQSIIEDRSFVISGSLRSQERGERLRGVKSWARPYVPVPHRQAPSAAATLSIVTRA